MVATPIGNLRDVTFRALDVLAAADLILCEDTRVSAKLLNHYGIARPTMAYHDHNAERVLPKVIERLKAGAVVAQISDAGTPLVSDPGFRLVAAATAADIPVVAIPGASAFLAALTVAGLPSDRFMFAGFAPAKTVARQRFFSEFKAIPATLAFYESPHRLGAALADMLTVFGDRPAAVCRELTKRFEEVRRGSLAGLAAAYGGDAPVRGEIVIVVGPPGEAVPMTSADIEGLLRDALTRLSIKEAAAEVALMTGEPRRALYARALAFKAETEEPS